VSSSLICVQLNKHDVYISLPIASHCTKSCSSSSSGDSYCTYLSYVPYPARQCFEALSVGDVEDDDDTLSLAVEGGGHRSKPLLTSGVPYL